MSEYLYLAGIVLTGYSSIHDLLGFAPLQPQLWRRGHIDQARDLTRVCHLRDFLVVNE
jgi:hypothetical protein